MKRRQFIKGSVLTAVSVAIPFSKIYAQKVGNMDKFTGTKINEKTKEEIIFEITLYNDLNTKFSEIPIENKIIKLTAYKKVDKNFKSYKVDLKAVSIKIQDDKKGIAGNVYKIETELLQTNSSEFDLPKELNIKKMTLLYHPEGELIGDEKDTVSILDKKNGVYLVLTYKNESSDEGCFLTTACMSIQGKEDNCYELSTLRTFRDQVLKSNVDGKVLIQEYYHIAPKIVSAIDQRNDKNRVYHEIYHDMVLPTIQNIENNNTAGAIEVYQNYTRKLESLYL